MSSLLRYLTSVFSILYIRIIITIDNAKLIMLQNTILVRLLYFEKQKKSSIYQIVLNKKYTKNQI